MYLQWAGVWVSFMVYIVASRVFEVRQAFSLSHTHTHTQTRTLTILKNSIVAYRVRSDVVYLLSYSAMRCAVRGVLCCGVLRYAMLWCGDAVLCYAVVW